MNLNLSYNSVGFYQLSKLVCIPIIIAIERVKYGKTVPASLLASLVPLLVGVGIATVNDFSLNLVGTVYAAVAVLTASYAQILTSHTQKELGCDALQLLHQACPFVIAGMLMAIPVFHNVVAMEPISRMALGRIAFSCVLAFGVNASNYVVLGKTSALTYQVLGHVKTISILVLGFILFHNTPSKRVVAGILVALVGGRLWGRWNGVQTKSTL